MFCTDGSVDNGLHFLIECPLTKYLRQSLYNVVLEHNPDFNGLSNTDKMIHVLSTDDITVTRSVARYVHMSFEHRKEALSAIVTL